MNQSQITRQARRGERVDILTGNGILKDVICAITDGYNSTPANCCFAHVYQTEGGVTQPGDSGSAAVVPATGEAIGTVVAGRHGFVSLIQKIGYQLSQSSLANIQLS